MGGKKEEGDVWVRGKCWRGGGGRKGEGGERKRRGRGEGGEKKGGGRLRGVAIDQT